MSNLATIDLAALSDVVGGTYRPPVRGPRSTIYNPVPPVRPLPLGGVLINRPVPRPTPF